MFLIKLGEARCSSAGFLRGVRGGTHPNPSHPRGQGSLESFQPRRSCPGRNVEVSPLMCAGKTRLASSQRQGSQPLASAVALPSKAASPTGPQHGEPEPRLPRRVVSRGCLGSRGRDRARGLSSRLGCVSPHWRKVSAPGLGSWVQHQELHHQNKSWGGRERAARRGEGAPHISKSLLFLKLSVVKLENISSWSRFHKYMS